MKHKRDDGPEKQEDEAVDVTPLMICVFVVMCCCMLVLLYYFYDQLGLYTRPRKKVTPTKQVPPNKPLWWRPCPLKKPRPSPQVLPHSI